MRQSQMPSSRCLPAIIVAGVSTLMMAIPAAAEPTVINNNRPIANTAIHANNNTNNNVNNNVITNQNTANGGANLSMARATTAAGTQNALNNPASPNSPTSYNNVNGTSAASSNTLASQLQPTFDELSTANQQLLSRNARLQRDVNELDTQVKVLVNERSGQLFMYGTITVIAGILVGIFIGWLVFARRERW